MEQTNFTNTARVDKLQIFYEQIFFCNKSDDQMAEKRAKQSLCAFFTIDVPLMEFIKTLQKEK